MNTGLENRILDLIRGTCAGKPGIKRLILYGSRAKGTWRDNSDIDLCLDAPEWGVRELSALDQDLDDLLLPWKIDLVLLHLIDNPALQDHIDHIGMDLLKK